MEREIRQAYDAFLDTVSRDSAIFVRQIDASVLETAAGMIMDAQRRGNRLHISGIGKTAYAAEYAAALFSSTGTPAYFLHGTEAVHGSCGQLVPGDIVIFLSNSGETPEMRAAAEAVHANGCQIIGVSGNPESWLALTCECHLFAGVPEEGGPLNRAPRMSLLAEIILLQALSVILQASRRITPQQYIKWHPGGTLGQLRTEEMGRVQPALAQPGSGS